MKTEHKSTLLHCASSAVFQIPEPIYLEALAAAAQSTAKLFAQSLYTGQDTRRHWDLASPAIKPHPLLTDSADAAFTKACEALRTRSRFIEATN